MSTPNNGQTHGRRPSGSSARSGEGTATSSPSNASATKTAALSRQASIARKRTSLGPGTPRTAVPSGSNSSPAAAKTKRTSTSSTALARITSSSSSSSGLDDFADAGPGTAEDGTVSEAQAAATATGTSTPEELSRMSRDQLVALIVRERDYKDELEVKVHDLGAEHATLSEQHDDLQKTQSLHEKKLEDAYATTARMELQLAEQNDALESAKQAERAAEKEGNDAQKRFLEQVELFDSERTKWEEVEQSLQAQLAEMRQIVQQQSLAIENHARTTIQESQEAVTREEQPKLDAASSPIPVPLSATLTSSPTFQIPDSTLEELQALHTKVALLSSEHELAQSEAQRLQAQLEDLERMNADLQEQNENYEVLLGERMLAGLGLGALADSGVGSSANTSSLQELGSEGGRSSRPPSSLDRLEEESDDDKSEDDLPEIYETSGDGNLSTGGVAAKIAPNRISKTAQKRQSMIGFGSSFGNGGLDLGAELDRARQEEEERIKAEETAKRKKKAANARRRANQTSTMSTQDQESLPADVDTLRKEVKLLRQENKGLSTYVSKILERIIGIEGFEKVLSVERSPVPPVNSPPPPAAPVHISRSADDALPPPTPAKSGFASSSQRPPLPLRAQTSVGDAGIAATAPLSPTGPPPTAGNAAANKKNRFSMDWLWKSKEDAKAVANAAPATALPAASAPAPGLKPMMLSGAPAQKQAPEEDEDDRRARARLQSEMRLLGLDAHGRPASQTGTPGSVKIGAARSPGKRMSSGGSFGLGSSPRPPSLPAKQQEEDETAAREKAMRHELDNGRASGFTELPPVGAPGDGVKIRGHRKRPSGDYAPAGLEPGSIGLGVSYSRASTGSTWSDRSPSLQGGSECDAGEKRSSAGSDVKT